MGIFVGCGMHSDLAAKLKNGVAAAKKQAKNKYEKDR